jgi:hypothetical protein
MHNQAVEFLHLLYIWWACFFGVDRYIVLSPLAQIILDFFCNTLWLVILLGQGTPTLEQSSHLFVFSLFTSSRSQSLFFLWVHSNRQSHSLQESYFAFARTEPIVVPFWIPFCPCIPFWCHSWNSFWLIVWKICHILVIMIFMGVIVLVELFR